MATDLTTAYNEAVAAGVSLADMEGRWFGYAADGTRLPAAVAFAELAELLADLRPGELNRLVRFLDREPIDRSAGLWALAHAADAEEARRVAAGQEVVYG